MQVVKLLAEVGVHVCEAPFHINYGKIELSGAVEDASHVLCIGYHQTSLTLG